MPVVPWEGAPAARGPPINCHFLPRCVDVRWRLKRLWTFREKKTAPERENPGYAYEKRARLTLVWGPRTVNPALPTCFDSNFAPYFVCRPAEGGPCDLQLRCLFLLFTSRYLVSELAEWPLVKGISDVGFQSEFEKKSLRRLTYLSPKFYGGQNIQHFDTRRLCVAVVFEFAAICWKCKTNL